MFAKILVPLDGSALAESALPYATALAEQFGGQLSVLRVVPPTVMPALEYSMVSADLMATVREEHLQGASDYLKSLGEGDALKGVPHRVLLSEGEIAETILECIEEVGADAVVMATHGRSGIARWMMGSVADRVVRNARVPVLLVRP